ncbi:TPA: hypothetical protein ACK3Q6_002691 [Burkholderia cepacia]|uniref:hypothetical protein n=2 Tax=Burkholderia cepacia complex TaxID=87882 RepID=UPI001CF39F4C|nr:hypothetical protein [Burkholderia cepacia]HDR9764138.1 hypothetical protein [Burkholderia cepacia ATCC 25416]MCA8361200.1 hypothetical protein [Burkholderia cepacia]HDR9769788.1 hypothetical protein [Burkholderia cepacia ATCC 25416]HDR9778699.1 hypothetical protein [Burkholderia cepacia ATCC 25416]HDR9787918.1 hypothetical protein [Burkholderia cepacia ATCC 25416]
MKCTCFDDLSEEDKEKYNFYKNEDVHHYGPQADFQSKAGVMYFLDELYVKNYTINDDLTVDVEGDVKLPDYGVKHMLSDNSYSICPESLPIQFGIVKGDFHCGELKDLHGAPRHVTGNFVCEYTDVKSLEGMPEHVGKDITIRRTAITNLEGLPNYIAGNLEIDWNDSLTSLNGSPKTITGEFVCTRNASLKTLEGGPERVGAGVYISPAWQKVGDEKNKCCGLISLEGAPEYVGGNFDCSDNELNSLNGAPKHVEGDFVCVSCSLETLNGLGEVKGKLNIQCNPGLSLSEIAHIKAARGITLDSSDYTDEEIDKAVKIINLHENLSQTIKQKDDVPMARAASTTQVSATRTGKRKI